MAGLQETHMTTATRLMKSSTVKAMNTAAIAEATGMSWAIWCKKLDAVDGKSLSHGEIAKAAQRIKPVSGWWAQGVAVAYEQHIGRRKPGQLSDGSYSASATRTVIASREEAFEKWRAFATTIDGIGGASFSGEPIASHTPKRSYWKCSCANGTKVIISFENKPNGRTLIAVEHQKLKTETSLAKTKIAWVKTLAVCLEK